MTRAKEVIQKFANLVMASEEMEAEEGGKAIAARAEIRKNLLSQVNGRYPEYQSILALMDLMAAAVESAERKGVV
jgi:hypothetical protein